MGAILLAANDRSVSHGATSRGSRLAGPAISRPWPFWPLRPARGLILDYPIWVQAVAY